MAEKDNKEEEVSQEVSQLELKMAAQRYHQELRKRIAAIVLRYRYQPPTLGMIQQEVNEILALLDRKEPEFEGSYDGGESESDILDEISGGP